jgi:uncharacterized protein (DUF3084 family)
MSKSVVWGFSEADKMAVCLQVARDMARRAADGNYESDIEEEEAAAQQEAQQQSEAAGAGGDEAAVALKVLAEAEKKLKKLHEQEERLKVNNLACSIIMSSSLVQSGKAGTFY